MKTRITLLLGSVRNGRKSLGVARYLQALLTDRGGVTVTFQDLAEYKVSMMEDRMVNQHPARREMDAFSQEQAASDGILVVAPEYKGSYPGVLKNALDYLDPGIWRRKPIAICTVSAAQYGGIQCLNHLRLLSLAMQGLPVPQALLVGNVASTIDDEGTLLDEHLAPKSEKFLNEWLWYVHKLKSGTAFAISPDQSMDKTSITPHLP